MGAVRKALRAAARWLDGGTPTDPLPWARHVGPVLAASGARQATGPAGRIARVGGDWLERQ
ncbi:hypothetical protein ACIQF6_30395, partial [Kitasatospora sp. NPDC092948]|uniref:hypothetical protein n=1 Tax=Kitasatospora sp. NPDC092948 TaxID=3364088 RepID=UPI00380FC5C8